MRVLSEGKKRGSVLRLSAAVAGAVAAATATLPNPARAATFVWDAGTDPATSDRMWGTAINWNPDGVPGSGTAPSTGANDIVTFSSTTASVFGNIDLGGVDRVVDQV